MTENANLYQINRKLAELYESFHLPVEITSIHDPTAPKVSAYELNGISILKLNTANIPISEYQDCAGYHVGRILLPKLFLETERLVLRRYIPEDADKCYAFLSNEQDAYMDCCKAFNVRNEEYYDRVALFVERETQYMIVLKDSNEVIGTVNVFEDNSRAVDAVEIGYSIAHAHQRRGYAFEALSALLDLLQIGLYMNMVTAGVLPENIASEQLLLKLGFHREGLRHNAVWHEGLDKPVDLVYFYRDRPVI